MFHAVGLLVQTGEASPEPQIVKYGDANIDPDR